MSPRAEEVFGQVRLPSLSGDGLVLLAEVGEGKNAATKIFMLPVNGGDPRPITSAPMGIEQFAWRADGAVLAPRTGRAASRFALAWAARPARRRRWTRTRFRRRPRLDRMV